MNTTARTASLIEYKNAKDVDKDERENVSGPSRNVFGMVEELRKLAGNKSESVGRKQIGDTEAEGFRVETEGFTLTIRANPKTRTPLLIEIPIRVGDQENLATLGDFQLD